MKKFGIVADTSNDLSEDYIREKGIINVSFYVEMGGEYYRDNIELNREELYRHLRENPDIYPKTSLPSVDDYIKAYKKFLEVGEDALCFTVSSGLSGSYQSAKLAAEMAMEEFPDRRVYVIDSYSASLGVGILMEKAVEFRDSGMELEEVYEKLSEKAKKSEVYILLDTLNYLEKGGRISKTKAMAGNLLKIKPIVSFKNNDLKREALARGPKKALREIIGLVEGKILEKGEDYLAFIIHGDNLELAKEARKKIEEDLKIQIYEDMPLVSSAVISHIGPGAIGVGIMEK